MVFSQSVYQVSKRFGAESCFPLTRIIKRNDLPHLTFHGLRHAFATIARKAGINAKIVSEALSQPKVGITIDLHQHVLANMQRDGAPGGIRTHDPLLRRYFG